MRGKPRRGQRGAKIKNERIIPALIVKQPVFARDSYSIYPLKYCKRIT